MEGRPERGGLEIPRVAVPGGDEEADVLDGVADAPGPATDCIETLVVGDVGVLHQVDPPDDGGDGVYHLVAEDAVEDDRLLRLAREGAALAAVPCRLDADERPADGPADERVGDERARLCRQPERAPAEHRIQKRESGHEPHPDRAEEHPQRDGVDVPRFEGADSEADTERREPQSEN